MITKRHGLQAWLVVKTGPSTFGPARVLGVPSSQFTSSGAGRDAVAATYR